MPNPARHDATMPPPPAIGDLAPTIDALAGVAPPPTDDGAQARVAREDRQTDSTRTLAAVA